MRLILVLSLSVLFSLTVYQPVFGQTYDSYCASNPNDPRCGGEELEESPEDHERTVYEHLADDNIVAPEDNDVVHHREDTVPQVSIEEVSTTEVTPEEEPEKPEPVERVMTTREQQACLSGHSSCPTTNGKPESQSQIYQYGSPSQGMSKAIEDQYAANIKEFDKIYGACVEDTAPQARECCKPDLVNSSCEAPNMKMIVQNSTQIAQQMRMIASLTSTSAICKVTKQTYHLSNALTIAATGMCIKAAASCNQACQLPDFDCIDMHGAHKQDKEDLELCKEKMAEIKSNSTSCKWLHAGNTVNTLMTVKIARLQKKTGDVCNNVTDVVAETEAPDCSDPDVFAITPECNIQNICNGPEAVNNPLCPNVGSNTGNDDSDAFTLPSDGDPNPTAKIPGDGKNAFPGVGEGQEDNGLFNQLQSASESDQNAPSGSGGSGGGSAASASGGGGGSSGSGQGGGARGKSKGRNILKGFASGNGYVSRFKGSSGGGGYRARGASRSRGGRSGKSRQKFSLKSFFKNKAKKITKGRLKGYNRLPSGNLMAPQSLDIFDVHHKSYQDACSRQAIIKGCGSKQKSKLGLSPTSRELNSRYRSQLALQKETQSLRLRRSGIKISSLQNNISQQASTTYYQIKYLKNNKLNRLPKADPLASLSSKSGKTDPKYKHWHKMQAWVNSKSGKKLNRTRNSDRLPASVGQ